MALSNEQLSEFDLIIAIDTSGSMSTPSSRFAGKNRLQEGEELIVGFARVMEPIDEDGLTLITFGGTVDVHDGVKADAIASTFAKITPYGSTPTHTAIARAREKAAASGKKTICVVLTDGEPNDRQAVIDEIIAQANSQAADDDFTFLFVQVGHDTGAAAFLDHLDDGLQAAGAKFDIVDAVKAETAEQLSPNDLLEKAIND